MAWSRFGPATSSCSQLVRLVGLGRLGRAAPSLCRHDEQTPPCSAPTTTAAARHKRLQRRQPSNHMAPPRDIGGKRASATLPGSGPSKQAGGRRRQRERWRSSTATTANNTLNGTNAADGIYGRGGDDILNGRDGADVLEGGDHDDVLEGGAGADELFGGAGFDYGELSQLGQRHRHRLGQLRFSRAVTLTAITSTASRASIGSAFAEQDGGLVAGGNVFRGEGGNDTLSGSQEARQSSRAVTATTISTGFGGQRHARRW